MMAWSLPPMFKRDQERDNTTKRTTVKPQKQRSNRPTPLGRLPVQYSTSPRIDDMKPPHGQNRYVWPEEFFFPRAGSQSWESQGRQPITKRPNLATKFAFAILVDLLRVPKVLCWYLLDTVDTGTGTCNETKRRAQFSRRRRPPRKGHGEADSGAWWHGWACRTERKAWMGKYLGNWAVVVVFVNSLPRRDLWRSRICFLC